MRTDDTRTRSATDGSGESEEKTEREGSDVRMRVDHVGIAVEAIAAAEPVLGAFGAEKLTEESLEEFTWAYYRLGNGSRIELIEPRGNDREPCSETDDSDGDEGNEGKHEGDGESSGGSFLTDFLDRYGPGLHHVTLEVTDLDGAIAQVETAGLRVVDRTDEDDWREAFVSPHNPTGTLFQLMEYREGYAESREQGSELFVGGRPLGK